MAYYTTVHTIQRRSSGRIKRTTRRLRTQGFVECVADGIMMLLVYGIGWYLLNPMSWWVHSLLVTFSILCMLPILDGE